MVKRYIIRAGQDKRTWPALFKRLDREAPGALNQLLGQAGQLTLEEPLDVPLDVIKDIEQFSDETQDTFISSWLNAFITEGRRPKITRQDRRQHPTSHYEAMLRRIQRYANQQLILEAPGGNPELAAYLNETLAPLRREMMAEKLEFESYNKRTKTSQEVFYTVAATAALGLAIDTVPFLKPLDAFKEKFMAQLDDYGNWAGEIASVKGQGYDWGQVIKSQWLALPALAWTLVADVQFRQKHLPEEGGAQGALSRAADKVLAPVRWFFGEQGEQAGIEMSKPLARFARGMKFGLSGSILSVAAAVSTLFMMAGQHARLAREGKVLTTGQPQNAKPLQRYWYSLKRAFHQDIQYPARVGLFTGAAISTLSAGVLGLIRLPKNKGEFLLSLTVVQALVGAGESLGASLTSALARRRHEAKLDRLIEQNPH